MRGQPTTQLNFDDFVVVLAWTGPDRWSAVAVARDTGEILATSQEGALLGVAVICAINVFRARGDEAQALALLNEYRDALDKRAQTRTP